MQFLLSHPPGAVVLASASDTYLESAEIEVRAPDGTAAARTATAKADVWLQGLERTARLLTEAGIKVVIVHPVPKFVDWDSRGCAVFRVLVNQASCGVVAAWQDLRPRQLALDVESEVGRRLGLSVLDFAEQLCAEDHCASHRNDVWLWRDGGHISVDASVLLGPAFAQVL